MKRLARLTHLTPSFQNLLWSMMMDLGQEANMLICKSLLYFCYIISLYRKLLKFRGKDLGKSKFEIERGVS